MNETLARYLCKRVGGQTLALMLVLAGIMQLLELLDITTDILDRGLGVSGLLHYAALRLPAELVLGLPLATLLGAMSAFFAMARSLEITAMRCAGLSLRRIALLLLPVPILLAGIHLTLSQTTLPGLEARLADWWASTTPEDERDDPLTWVQTQAGPASFHASLDGKRLRDLTVYAMGEDGLQSGAMRAERAEWSDGNWVLSGISRLRVPGAAPAPAAEVDGHWETNLRPDDLLRLGVAQPHLSSMTLVDVISGERVGALPESYYRTVLYRSFEAPIGIFVMFLLALPVAGMSVRSGSSGMLAALGLGLSYLLVDGLVSSLGTSGQIYPLLSALVAPLLFALIGLIRLVAHDR